MNTRVEIPAYTDHWMRGDRYGVIVRITRQRRHMANAVRAALLTLDPHEPAKEVAHVKLDKSGRTARFYLADCREI